MTSNAQLVGMLTTSRFHIVIKRWLNQWLLHLRWNLGKKLHLQSQGVVPNYLGMMIDFMEPGKVKFSMHDYIQDLIDECAVDLQKGSATMPATNQLFQLNPEAANLGAAEAEVFHHLITKLLYLSKCTHLDLQTAIAFLTMQVQTLDIDDCKKLGHCLQYFWENPDLLLTLEADDSNIIYWWNDASYTVDPATQGPLSPLGRDPFNQHLSNNESTQEAQQRLSWLA